MSEETRYDWVSALVDGQLAGQELQDARRNLAEDADAQKLFEQLQSMREDLRSLPQLTLGKEFPDRVMQQVGTLHASSPAVTAPSKPATNHWRNAIAVFSAVAAMLLVGILIFVNQPNGKSHVAHEESNVTSSNVDAKKRTEGDQSIPTDDFAANSFPAPMREESPALSQQFAIEKDADLPLTENLSETQPANGGRKDNLVTGSDGSVNGNPDFRRAMGVAEGQSLDLQTVNGVVQPAETITAFVSFKDHDKVKQLERLLRSSGVEFVEAAEGEVADEEEVANEGTVKKAGEGSLEAVHLGKKLAAELSDEALKDRVSGYVNADVLMVEAPLEVIESVFDQLDQDTHMRFDSFAYRNFSVEEFSETVRTEFFAKLRDSRLQESRGASGVGGGGIDRSELADDKMEEKIGASTRKNQPPEKLKSERFKLDTAGEVGKRPAEKQIENSQPSSQAGKSSSEEEGRELGAALSLRRSTARYLKDGTAGFDRFEEDLVAIRESSALAENSKELKKDGDKGDAETKFSGQPGSAKNRIDSDSERQESAGQEESADISPLGAKSPTANKPRQEPLKMVRLYIVANANSVVIPTPAAASAAEAKPDDD